MCVCVCVCLIQIKDHSSIASPNRAALSHRNPTVVTTVRDICGAQNSDKRNAL